MQITNEVKNGFKETEIGLIPEDWELVKLKDIAKIRLGRTPERKKKEYWENGKIPWVKVGDLDNAIIYDTSEKISEVAFKEKFYSKFIPKGTLLFSFKLTIGKVGILGMDAVHNEAIASLFVDEDKVDKHFLFFLLPLLNFKTLLDRYVKGNTLNREKLKILPIPLPPLLEQQKIAFVLSKIQQAIEHQDKIIEATKNLKKSLMRKLFTEGIGHTEFKDSEIGRIPKSWEVVRLEEVGTRFVGGGTPSTVNKDYWGGEIPWMTSAFISDFYVKEGQKYITKEGLENSATALIPKNNILIGTRVGTGKVAVNLIDIAISQDLTGIIVDKQKVITEYLAYTLISPRVQEQILSKNRGVTIKGITREDLKTVLIPLPPKPEQLEITSSLSVVDKKIRTEEKRKALLEHLFKTMLSKLMTGEIRVKDLDLSDYHVN